MNEKIRFLIVFFLFNSKKRLLRYGHSSIQFKEPFYYVKIWNEKSRECNKNYHLYIKSNNHIDKRGGWYKNIENNHE